MFKAYFILILTITPLCTYANHQANMKKETETLFYAVENNLQEKVSKILTEHPSLIGSYLSNQRTLLHIAASKGHTKLCHLLVCKGAKVNARESLNFETPLHLAAESGHLETIKLLISLKANWRALTKNEKTAFDYAWEKGEESCANYFSNNFPEIKNLNPATEETEYMVALLGYSSEY